MGFIDTIKNFIGSQASSNAGASSTSVLSSAINTHGSIFDSTSTTIDTRKYDTDLWEDIDFSVDTKTIRRQGQNFTHNTGTYTYTTKDGSTIRVKDTDNVTVRQNKETGEIVVIGANASSINLSKDANITVIESTVDSVSANKGNAEITVQGAHTIVGEVKGDKGSQVVVVSDGAHVEKIDTGDDDDVILLSYASAGKIDTGNGNNAVVAQGSLIENNIKTGKGEDTIIIGDNSTTQGKIETGKGNDRILIDSSATSSKINTGAGDDVIEVNNATLNGQVSSGKGNDNLTIKDSTINNTLDIYGGDNEVLIENSTLKEGKDIRTSLGSDKITIKDSKIDGNIVAADYYEGLDLTFDNTVVGGSVKNVRSDDVHYINSSASGVVSFGESTREVAPLDTSEGSEFEGFVALEAQDETRTMYVIQNYDGTYQVIDKDTYINNGYSNLSVSYQYEQTSYKLEDGTVIWADSDGGEVYVNPNSGEIVLNGLNNADIISSSSAKVIAIDSCIQNHTDIQGDVEYRNCIVENVEVKEGNNVELSAISSNISNIDAKDANVDLNAIRGADISNVTIRGEGGLNLLAADCNIGTISALDKANVNIETVEGYEGKITVNKITSKEGLISGNLDGISVENIITTNGSIDVSANGAKIGTIKNSGKEGVTKVDFSDVELDKIVSSSRSDVVLDNCKVTSSLTASQYDDYVSLNNSDVKKVDTGYGEDELEMTGGSANTVTVSDFSNKVTLSAADIKTLSAQGDITLRYSDVQGANLGGNIALQGSNVTNLSAEYGENNVYIKDSIVETEVIGTDSNVYEDNFGEITTRGNYQEALNSTINSAVDTLNQLNEDEAEDLCALIEYFEGEDISFTLNLDGRELSATQIIEMLSQNPTTVIEAVKSQLIAQMEGSLKTLEQAIEDDKNSLGLFGGIAYIFNTDQQKLEQKREILDRAVQKGDMGSILSAYKLLTDEVATADTIKEKQAAFNYAASLDRGTQAQILSVLGYIGNVMDYSITEQDGAIKSLIAVGNMLFDIGTNQMEAKAYVQTYKDNLAQLVEKFNNGTLDSTELALEYKRLTGYELTQENVSSILDNVRDNDQFKNIAQNEIVDYQDTQQTIFQVGEYAVVILAGTAVTLATGGAAGPEIAAALTSLGKMGVALSATTVSFAVKTGIELAERQTNGIVSDDVTTEELIKSAALMYSGCLSGQFGSFIGDLVGSAASDWLESEAVGMILGKLADLSADSLVCYATTGMITGDAEFSEEFMQNVKQQLVGLIQSKITNAYFAANAGKIAVNNYAYEVKQQRAGLDSSLSEFECNAKLLEQYGLSRNYAGMSADEVDALIVTTKAMANLDQTTLLKYLEQNDNKKTASAQKAEYNEEYLKTASYNARMNYLESGNFEGARTYMRMMGIVESDIDVSIKQFESEQIYALCRYETDGNIDKAVEIAKSRGQLLESDTDTAKAFSELMLIKDAKFDIGVNIDNLKNVCQDSNSAIKTLILQDIDLVYKSMVTGESVNDLMVPTKASVSEGVNSVKTGDFFEVKTGNSSKMYIKTGDNAYQELNISKDTYCELFPVVSRYASGQQQSGDCYLVAALNAINANPAARAKMLSCISEYTNGEGETKIKITLPNSSTSVEIAKGKGIESLEVDTKKLMNGALGMQLLEYSYKVTSSQNAIQQIQAEFEVASKELNEAFDKLNSLGMVKPDWDYTNVGMILSNIAYGMKTYAEKNLSISYDPNDPQKYADFYKLYDNSNLEKLFSGLSSNESGKYFNSDGNLSSEGMDYLRNVLVGEANEKYIYADVDDIDGFLRDLYSEYIKPNKDIWDLLSNTSDYAEKAVLCDEIQYRIFDEAETNTGHGGRSNDVFRAFGFEDAQVIEGNFYNSKLFKEFINNPESAEGYLITAGTVITKSELEARYNDPKDKNYEFYHLHPEIYQQRLDAALDELPYGLVARHAYSAKFVQDDKGNVQVELYNPWATDNVAKVLSLDEFNRYFYDIYTAKV